MNRDPTMSISHRVISVTRIYGTPVLTEIVVVVVVVVITIR